MLMMMSASERTHPSLHRNIRNNAKHKRFCRGPHWPCLINSNYASWTPKTRLLRGTLPSTPPPRRSRLIFLEGTRSQFGGLYCR